MFKSLCLVYEPVRSELRGAASIFREIILTAVQRMNCRTSKIKTDKAVKAFFKSS